MIDIVPDVRRRMSGPGSIPSRLEDGSAEGAVYSGVQLESAEQSVHVAQVFEQIRYAGIVFGEIDVDVSGIFVFCK